ncbi:MAG: HYR domain-containing protein [Bacteroidetes bacterium]|nr:HYR domain-containing protein [Bacteroidota bacterium]
MKQKLLRICLLFSFALFVNSNSIAQCDAPISSMFATNGTVNTSVFDAANNLFYIGGDFTVVNPFYTQGALLSGTTGEADRTFPVVSGGNVLASVSDGSGGFYIAGAFTSVGGLTRNRLAHINSSGQVTSWDPNADNSVNAITISGSTIYVGGSFTNVGGQARNYIAAIDATTGLATSWDPNGNNSINAIIVDGSSVFVGGTFTTIGGQTRNNIAALDITTGSATAWNPNADFLVSALALNGSTLYAGGTFTNIGGQARARIAALDVSTGLATSWNPASSAQVNCIAISGSTVYAGGAFTTIGGQARNRVAALDISTGTANSWNPNASATVRSIVVNGTNVFLGGDFLTVGGQTRNRIAEIDAAGLATSWNPDANSTVFTLTKDGTDVYAGGAFAYIGGKARNRIAALDASTGIATSWNPDINNSVYALALNGSTLYVGGLFTTVGGATRNRIAAISTSTGVATSWDPNASASVNALAVSGSLVYAGGTFATIGGQARTRLAALDASTGLATTWNPGAANTVKAIAISGNSVFIGGLFTTAGGQARNRLAEIDATTGTATAWNPAPSAVVNTLLVDAGTVYVGGAFNTIGGQARPRLAAINATTGLATSWNPSPNNLVYALGINGSTFYVAGSFTTIGGQSRNRVAGIDLGTGLATSWNPNAGDNQIYTITVGTPSIYIGGDFTNVGSNTSYRNSTAFSFGGITISTNPSNSSICAGANTTFSITASGGTSYQWEVSTDNGVTWNNASGGIYSNSNTTTLNLTNVTVGYNSYQYRCIVIGGSCSSGTASGAAVLTVNTTPAITGTTPADRCDTGTLNLLATSSGGTINWYDAPTAGNLVGTGTSFTTPSISSTTTYYVDATIGTCTSSPRTAVIATVNTTPSITGTTDASICDAGTVILGATASAGMINWYDATVAGNLVGTGTSYTTPSIGATTTYYVEVTNNGCTSSPRLAVVATVNSTPSITGTTPASRCGTGTLTLSATASAGAINWYNASTGGTLLGTGISYTTPSISATTTYYVDADDNGCASSPRIAITATVTPLPLRPANTTPAANLTICAGTSTVLTVSGVGTIGWYSAATGGTYLGGGNTFATPVLFSTTTFYAQDSTCGASALRRAITVSTNDVIAPVFTAMSDIVQSADAGQCSAIVSYAAPSASDNCSAVTITSNFSSGDVFFVGTTTVYDTARDASGNTTIRSFTITVNDNELPTITCPVDLFLSLSPGTCSIDNLALSSPLVSDNCGVLSIVNNAPASFFVGSTTVKWYVTDNSGNVDSCSQIVDVSGVPSAPPAPSDITPISNLTICSGNSTMLSVSGMATISWYDAPTGGNYLAAGTNYTTLSLSSTTTFYVQDSSCLASPRTAITVTVNPTPSVVSSTPASRCDAGTVILNATASAGTINWYDASTGGNLVGSGTAFTTPVISSSTIYFVEVDDNGCISSPRTPVVATVNATPSILSVTPASRCDAGTVMLNATASAGTINWYDASTAGNLVGTGVSFTTPSINSSTTYYVEATSNGCTTLVRTDVTATVNTTPSVLSSTPASRCDAGTVTLNATVSSGTLNWYDAATAGNLLGTGTSFTTPSIASTTPYYVEAIENGCASSPRVAVVATVNTTPSITSTSPDTRCDAGTLALGAVGSAGTVDWYDDLSAGNLVGTGTTFTTPVLSSNTTYYVEVTSNGCTSSPRIPVLATVNNTPSVLSTSPGTRCDAGSVSLGATSSAGNVNWYDNITGGNLVGTGTTYTTPSISVTTTYYVEAIANGCASSPRIPVIATINTTPSFTSTTPASRCDAGTVVLGASATSGIITWYDAPVAGNILATGTSYTTPSITATTTYYVEVSENGCTSSPRVAVVATVNTTPSIVSTTPSSRCDSGDLTLGAVASAGTINWYDAATAGNLLATGTSYTTPILSSTTTYYLEAVSNGCASSPLVSIVATVNTTPTILSTTPASRCDAGSLSLGATASAGTISWFDAVTGGNLVGTGVTYITPSLSSSTTYYVEVSNNGCVSNPRQPVVASVTIIDNTVSLASTTVSAHQNFASYQWLDCNNSFSPIVGETSQFFTPTVTGDYAVQITLNSCVDTSACMNVIVVGIEENQKPVVEVYPNPSAGFITIKNARAGTYQVFNELGQVVMSLVFEANADQYLNMNDLKNGTYFLIGGDKQDIFHQKIIILK